MVLDLIVSTITQSNCLFVFLPIQQLPYQKSTLRGLVILAFQLILWHNSLNLFDDCVTSCDLYICSLRRKNAPLLPKETVKYAHLAPQQIHSRRLSKQQKGSYRQSKNFRGTIDTIRHLKTFFLIKSQFYFLLYFDDIFVPCRYIQRRFFKLCFNEQVFF